MTLPPEILPDPATTLDACAAYVPHEAWGDQPRRHYPAMLEAEAICGDFGVTVESLLGRERSRHAAAVRRCVCLAMVGHGLTRASIGRLLNRDHTTITHYVTTGGGA